MHLTTFFFFFKYEWVFSQFLFFHFGYVKIPMNDFEYEKHQVQNSGHKLSKDTTDFACLSPS